jgi:hypothetical protein
MTEDRDLQKLSSKELHRRALRLAERRLDVAFLWSLVEAIPAAETAIGNVPESQADIRSLRTWLNDFLHSGEGNLADVLRPLYIQYLKAHETPDKA